MNTKIHLTVLARYFALNSSPDCFLFAVTPAYLSDARVVRVQRFSPGWGSGYSSAGFALQANLRTSSSRVFVLVEGLRKSTVKLRCFWLPPVGQRISFSLFTNQRPGQQHSSCPLLCGKQFTGLFPLRSNPCVSFRRTGCESSTGLKIKEIPLIVYLFYFGSPSWTRTNDPAVNSRMLYRLSYRGLKIRRRPTLPGRVRPSTIGAERLNFCVRYGYRWFPFAFVTEIVEYAFSSHRTFTTAYVLSPSRICVSSLLDFFFLFLCD